MDRTKNEASSIPQATAQDEDQRVKILRSSDLKTTIEDKIRERRRIRQQAELEKEALETGVARGMAEALSSSKNMPHSPELYVNEGLRKVQGDSSSYYSEELSEDLPSTTNGSQEEAPHIILDDEPEEEVQYESSEERNPEQQNLLSAMTHPSMTPQETKWWAMSFEELYQHPRSKNFGHSGTEGRKSGRVKIIKWLCEKEGIEPYVAPSMTPPVEAAKAIARPMLLPTGATSHPEAILCTSDPFLQRLIHKKEKEYRQWTTANLLELAMQRSYQLLKDSHGKLPSRSAKSMSKWLAAWDVLKSPREKKWWLGNGIDLVNKAKAMGYTGGSSRKYDVILWLRTTPKESEIEVSVVAEPTPNRGPAKHKAGVVFSNRHAKGSKRPRGWDLMKFQ